MWMPRLDERARNRAPDAPSSPSRMRSASLLGLSAASGLLALLQTAGEQRIRPEASAEVTRVVDGDTLDVLLDGEEVTLRLLSVDTEEKISGLPLSSPTKPQTVFGQETALWAKELFASFEPPVRIGLLF